MKYSMTIHKDLIKRAAQCNLSEANQLSENLFCVDMLSVFLRLPNETQVLPVISIKELKIMLRESIVWD